MFPKFIQVGLYYGGEGGGGGGGRECIYVGYIFGMLIGFHICGTYIRGRQGVSYARGSIKGIFLYIRRFMTWTPAIDFYRIIINTFLFFLEHCKCHTTDILIYKWST